MKYFLKKQKIHFKKLLYNFLKYKYVEKTSVYFLGEE
jgi:hypothetical protein